MVATAIIGSAVVGAGASMAGASKQAGATKKASDSQMAMYQQTREDLLPYNEGGQSALKTLQNRLTELTSPVVMDQETLEKTPGYQFNLQQGLKSTQNSAAARGLGNSGAALKGAASYATGLADSTYQNQFNNAVTNQTNAYNRLMGLVQSGQNAAAQTGAYGTQTAQSIGQNTIAGGTATAAGYTGAANALTNGVGNYLQYNALRGGMYGYPSSPGGLY
ncbi:DNA transfer protein p32 [Rhizobium puerariae]|uniref:DNA transfer protein p32 n=1 Tax=Rhizobium puerariae TaxID=1585791 RepID=A0ABV6ARU0_9HYPH